MGPFDSLKFEKSIWGMTAGHLVILKPWPVAGHLDTSLIKASESFL